MKRLLILLLLVPIAFATTIEQAETTADMREQNTIIAIDYIIVSDSEENLVFRLPSDVKKLTIKADSEVRECTVELQEEESLARCGNTIKGTSRVTAEYQTRELRGMLGDQTIVKFTDKLQFKASNYRFKLKLPEGYIIPKENKQEFYVNPEPNAVLSDGQRIIIEWEAAQATRFSGTAIVQALETGSGPATLVGVIVATFVLTLIIVLGIQFIRDNRRKEVPEQHETKEVLPTFIESEQIVVDMLRKSDDNSLWQKHIEKECGFSKAKLSRVIRNLESRGVVIKESYGNTNKIVLKKNGE